MRYQWLWSLDDREVVEALRLMKNMGSGGTSSVRRKFLQSGDEERLERRLIKESTKSHKVDQLHFMALSENPPGF